MKLPGTKISHEEKVSRNPIKIISSPKIKKPDWIKIELPRSSKFNEVKKLIQENNLHTVCEEASCPNIGECFSNGTATFMIMGDICTRRCPFCDVSHGRPNKLDENEPKKLAQSIHTLGLSYVVITSVDRDDLLDSGANHFANCISEVRILNPKTKVEILVPDFRGREEIALKILTKNPPDVFNHNIETVPRLYKEVRPGSDYQLSLNLLHQFNLLNKSIPTKSGIMLGLGETFNEIENTLFDLKKHGVSMVTVGQYLQPTQYHLPVKKYLSPQYFKMIGKLATEMGFSSVASAPFVRSSYHADLQSEGLK
jgi:lipoic acid synthetase